MQYASSRTTGDEKRCNGAGDRKTGIYRMMAPADCLIVKLRSPHANANILSIKTDAAKKVPGIEAVYTWEDVPTQRFTMAGQTYPEPSPYDRLILDQHVRLWGSGGDRGGRE